MYNNNEEKEAGYYFALTDAVDHRDFHYGFPAPFLLNSVYKSHKMVDEYLCQVMLDSRPVEGSHGVLSDAEITGLAKALSSDPDTRMKKIQNLILFLFAKP